MTVSTGKVRVAVNGYGVIGKRVADAVSAQDDMELVGVADVVSDYRIRVAVERGYPVYASVPERSGEMQAAGVPVAGTLQELLAQVEVVVDCAPKKVAAANQAAYRAAGVKAIWQGGEKHELAGYSFVAQVNYAGALNRDSARVVSCNTTALSRISHALHGRGLARRVRAVLMRCATDPWESHRNGMINTAIPETKVPSHQGPDAQTVIPGLDITTLAGAGPYNLSHLHFAMIETTRPVDVDELRAILLDTPRVALVRAADGLEALNSVMELMRDLRRPRGDMWEVAVWEDALASDGREVYLTFQVHNEAIVIPENVDCIRALSGLEPDAAVSIAKTDASLGITRHFLPSTRPPHVTPGEGTPAGFKGAEEPTAPVTDEQVLAAGRHLNAGDPLRERDTGFSMLEVGLLRRRSGFVCSPRVRSLGPA
ncbi:type II glyceraldehyde-3-phosphate dehydrogenase [Deinococcus sp. YIM 134068]|uniref:type II glyceraldehyde-3-phosphate dehydrogenase n=1 Tax=Deinococcus lichenicola TaxID=3118910 RepID=UPI002F93C700